jgi:hypothetical protein
MTVTTRATSIKRRRDQMQTNAELQEEVMALRTQLADGSARMSKMNAELADTTARLNASLPNNVCEPPAEVVAVQAGANARLNASLTKKVREPQAEVVAVQAEATDAAADIDLAYVNHGPWRPADKDLAYITYGPWRPNGTRSFHGRYRFGSPGNYVYGGRFKSDGYPVRMARGFYQGF